MEGSDEPRREGRGRRVRFEPLASLAGLAGGERLLICPVREARPVCPRAYSYLGRGPGGTAVLSDHHSGREELHPYQGLEEAARSGIIFIERTTLEPEAEPGRGPARRARYARRHGIDPGDVAGHLWGRLELAAGLLGELGAAYVGEGSPDLVPALARLRRVLYELEAERRALVGGPRG